MFHTFRSIICRCGYFICVVIVESSVFLLLKPTAVCFTYYRSLARSADLSALDQLVVCRVVCCHHGVAVAVGDQWNE